MGLVPVHKLKKHEKRIDALEVEVQEVTSVIQEGTMIVSIPPEGFYPVVNLYVELVDGKAKLRVEWENNEKL